jgi:hypothetical protein
MNPMMNFCINCGNKLTPNDKFCSSCGSAVTKDLIPEKKLKTCPSCHHTAEWDDHFCLLCGTPLQSIEPNVSTSKSIVPEKTIPLNHSMEPTPKLAKEVSVEKQIQNHVNPNTKKPRMFLKIVIWGTVILAGLGGIFYSIGDSDSKIKTSSREITEEEMQLPQEEVRQANPVLSQTSTFKLPPNSKLKEIPYSDKIKVLIPANFNKDEQTLSISNASVDPAVMIEHYSPLMLIDLTLNNEQQPTKPVEISYTYDESDLDPNLSIEEQIDAFRWDKEGGGWVSLPMRIDEKNHTVSALVDHFSIPGFFLKTSIIGIVGEKLLNDVYITPKKNFKILYSKKAILADQDLNMPVWKSAPTGRTGSNKSDAPPYIQAIGFLLEEALNSYTNTYHFKNPAGIQKGFLGNYQKMVTVKVDSWYSVVTGSNASYEKIYERLHIPTTQAFNYEPTKITLAHELFHRIQAEYYGVLGMSRRANNWWLEATAEYAAYTIAYSSKVSGMQKGLGNNYLNFPINSTGEKKGTGYGWSEREYQYVTSIFIDYLVENGSNFKEMLTFDAEDYYMPIYSLDKYLYKTKQKSLQDIYRQFANWLVFSSKGHLSKYPYLTSGGENDRDIAIQNSTLQLADQNEVSYTFIIPEIFSSQLWGITLEDDNSNKTSAKTPVIIEVKDKSTGLSIDVFRLPKFQSVIDPDKPIYTFYTSNESKMILLDEGDALCIVATQGKFTGGNAEVVVRNVPVQLEIDPSELLDAVGNKPYLFKFKATDIPKEIEKIRFEWDFGDQSKSQKGFSLDIAVNSGEAENEVEHIYATSDKEEDFPLKVVLKDSKSGMVLASTTAPITLPIAKPSVFITERQVVGPPGATFDLTAKASPENKYRFVWEISGQAEKYDLRGKETSIAPILNKKGTYKVSVKLYDLDNHFLSEDHASISVEEDNGSPISFISVVLNGKVEQIFIPDGNKITYNLNLLRIAFNNEGSYDVNGTPFQSTISLHDNKVLGQFSPKWTGSDEKHEIVLLYDNFASKKLIGFRYKMNMSYNSGSSNASTTITLNNIPFKVESGKDNEGRAFYEYRFKGNVSPYIINCDHEDISTNRNGTFGAKWGKYEPEWEIYISVTF